MEFNTHSSALISTHEYPSTTAADDDDPMHIRSTLTASRVLHKGNLFKLRVLFVLFVRPEWIQEIAVEEEEGRLSGGGSPTIWCGLPAHCGINL